MKPGKIWRGKTGMFFAALILLAGCVDPSSGVLHEVYKYPENLWGEWIRIDTGRTWHITSNYLDGDSYTGGSASINLKRQSANVIEVAEKSGERERKYYLYASRIPNGSFHGAVVGDSAGRAGSPIKRFSMTGIGGISIVITNLNDKANGIGTKTDGDGNFTAGGIIPGDEYEIMVDGQSTTVTPHTDGENIGTVTVTEGVNFKTSISGSNDMMSLFTGAANYSFAINLVNTGTDDCKAATYRLAFSSGLTPVGVSLSEQVLGTIEWGKGKTIPIMVRCESVSGQSEYKTIDITVTDQISKKEWKDSVALKFNRTQAVFNITSERTISGVVIVPSAKAYHFTTSYRSNNHYAASVTVPQYSNDFLVVFSGATADTESRYSLGVNVAADSGFSGFTNLGNYESNDTEDNATRIQPGSKVMSYLHKNDIDYYRVNLETP